MWSPKLDPVRRKYQTLAPLLERLIAYIQQQLNINQKFIIPKLAGAALKLNDGEAYVLLEILARAGCWIVHLMSTANIAVCCLLQSRRKIS